MNCLNPQHDHFHWPGAMLPDGTEAMRKTPMFCADCGQPVHYDIGIETYVHDVDAACWLTPAVTDLGEATPCVVAP